MWDKKRRRRLTRLARMSGLRWQRVTRDTHVDGLIVIALHQRRGRVTARKRDSCAGIRGFCEENVSLTRSLLLCLHSDCLPVCESGCQSLCVALVVVKK